MRVLENLSPRHLELRSSLEAAIDEVSPQARTLQLDSEKRFDRELRDRLATMGVWGLGTPESLGGSGGDTVDQVVALEVLGRKCTSMAVYGVVSCLVTRMLSAAIIGAANSIHISDAMKHWLLRMILKCIKYRGIMPYKTIVQVPAIAVMPVLFA